MSSACFCDSSIGTATTFTTTICENKTFLHPDIQVRTNGLRNTTCYDSINDSDDSQGHTQEQHDLRHSQPQHQPQQHLSRHLNVWDLLGIGIGSTIGSGVFVLVGTVASQYSGELCWVSMLIGGIAATCSGICFAELSCRIPCTGSTYIYTKICLGNYAAFIAASCITLEYGVSGAAVARTWGDKVLLWIQPIFMADDAHKQQLSSILLNDANNVNLETSTFWSSFSSWLIPGSVINIPAFFISIIATCLLLSGTSTSKAITNWLTVFKMIIVFIMIFAGFCLYTTENITTDNGYGMLAPLNDNNNESNDMGKKSVGGKISNVFRGATISFFGYLGYDEVCCVAGEAINPTRDMPRAVLGTLCITTLCYVLGATALCGMLPIHEISATGGFPDAFMTRNVVWLAQLTGFGELISLPVVIVLCLLAQPRLTYSMAIDGLLPKMFAAIDPNSGNLTNGTAIAGIIMTIIATVCPFTSLDDLISGGILIAFSMTNTCLILLRCKPKVLSPSLSYCSTLQQKSFNNPIGLYRSLVCYNILCFSSSLLWSHGNNMNLIGAFQKPLAVILSAATFMCFLHMAMTFPSSLDFGGVVYDNYACSISPGYNSRHDPFYAKHGCYDSRGDDTDVTEDENSEYFATPAVPLIPCIGIAINWYLIAQLEAIGISFLCLYILLGSVMYFFTVYRRPTMEEKAPAVCQHF